MNDCKIYNDKTWLKYLQNKLSREEVGQAQFHLHTCAVCRDRLERMRKLEQAMETVTDPVEKKSFWQLPVFRMAAGMALLVACSAGIYVWLSAPAEKEYPIEIIQPPVYNAADSVKVEPDSVIVKDKKDTIRCERK